jgi:hypothetical protein
MAVPSWRDDAYDPDFDDAPVGVEPVVVLESGVKLYPAFFDKTYDHLYVDLDNWA